MAAAKNARWFVLYVDAPTHDAGSGDDKGRVAKNLILAEQLGAKTFKVSGLDVIDEISNFVRQHNINIVFLGRSGRKRWLAFFTKSLEAKLMHHLREVDVYLIAQEGQQSLRSQTSKC